MCGRYQFTVEEAADFVRATREIIAEIERKEQERIKTGEIRPTNYVPVLVTDGGQRRPVPMTWGFPNFAKGSGVIINARSESVTEKKTFRQSVLSRRCIVPSTGFFEWSHNGTEKTKYLFRLPHEQLLYMAGCWNTFRDKNCERQQQFVILTTEANESMLEDTGALSLFPDESGKRSLIHNRISANIYQALYL